MLLSEGGCGRHRGLFLLRYHAAVFGLVGSLVGQLVGRCDLIGSMVLQCAQFVLHERLGGCNEVIVL